MQSKMDWSEFCRTLQESAIPAGQLPEIDLYMDQIITIFNEGLASNRRSDQEKIFTKTMINNYSKDGLLKPIRGKKYSKDHLLVLQMIYHLKQTLSILDIKQLFDALDASLSQGAQCYDPTFVRGCYDDFVKMKTQLAQDVCAEGLQLPERIGLQVSDAESEIERWSDRDKLLMVLALCSLSNSFRRMAQQFMDRFLLPDEKQPEREKHSASTQTQL